MLFRSFSTYLASPPAIGSTTANTGAFTTLSASSTVTLSGGTANGVLYLDGSKAATSGSALTFDGTNFGIGTSSPAYNFQVQNSSGDANAFIGQSSSTGMFWQWHYNATTSSAYGEISTYAGSNHIYIQAQSSGGNTIMNLT